MRPIILSHAPKQKRGWLMRMFLRNVNESLIVDGRIQITVLEVHEDHVRLAISGEGQYWEEDLYLERAEEPAVLQVH